MFRQPHYIGNCQCCGRKDWEAGLLAPPHGHIHLCYGCARDTLRNRESKSRVQQEAYANLLHRAFRKKIKELTDAV